MPSPPEPGPSRPSRAMPRAPRCSAPFPAGQPAWSRSAGAFPLGDVCKVELFGTRGAQECRFLWPPEAEQSFLAALRLQAESFVRWVGGAPAEGASALDAVAALEAAEHASLIFHN